MAAKTEKRAYTAVMAEAELPLGDGVLATAVYWQY